MQTRQVAPLLLLVALCPSQTSAGPAPDPASPRGIERHSAVAERYREAIMYGNRKAPRRVATELSSALIAEFGEEEPNVRIAISALEQVISDRASRSRAARSLRPLGWACASCHHRREVRLPDPTGVMHLMSLAGTEVTLTHGLAAELAWLCTVYRDHPCLVRSSKWLATEGFPGGGPDIPPLGWELSGREFEASVEDWFEVTYSSCRACHPNANDFR